MPSYADITLDLRILISPKLKSGNEFLILLFKRESIIFGLDANQISVSMIDGMIKQRDKYKP